MRVLFSTNRLQSTIYAVRVTVSRPKRLQTVARFEKNYRMTPLVGLPFNHKFLRSYTFSIQQKIEIQNRKDYFLFFTKPRRSLNYFTTSEPESSKPKPQKVTIANL